jgi:homoserine dehydrogenase
MALAEQSISINRMRQIQHEGSEAPILIVTHRTSRPALDAAMSGIARLDVCLADPVALRIEDV